MKLLVVEDEALLRHHLQTRLTESGHVVEAVANAEEALYQTEQFNHDLAMIDLGLPGLGGLELIRQLRARGKTFPILILTARGNWQDKVEGLAAGADDYVVKPFQFEELDARLNALLRRSSGFTQPTIVAGAPATLLITRKKTSMATFASQAPDQHLDHIRITFLVIRVQLVHQSVLGHHLLVMAHQVVKYPVFIGGQRQGFALKYCLLAIDVQHQFASDNG